MFTMDRAEILKPLGFQRNRLLTCLGADLPHSPSYAEPDASADPFAYYRHFVRDLNTQWAAATDRATVVILAAARLLDGEIGAARVVAVHFPEHPIRTDHGAGICLVAPFYALASALPLPEALRDTSAWLAGSPQQTALLAWLDERATSLRWNESAGVYEFR